MLTVTVLVSASCPTCGQALQLARQLAAERPDVRVRVEDVDAPHWQAPASFAGTPMFLRGDTVVSYGNPTLAELHRALPREAA